jgi:hypothetical protein
MKRSNFVSVLVLATLVLGARSVYAQVTITGADPVAMAAFTAATGKTAADLEAQVNSLFQVANIASFLKGFQDAQSFSTKGLGVDYASEATLFEAGATVSFASNVDKAYKPSGSYSDPPISGGGANFSLMAGLGLGLVGFDPLMIFGNWFKGSATLGQLNGDYQNWGVHGQLRILGPSRSGSATQMLIRWGGIAITSGADYSHLTLSTRSSITSTINVTPDVPVTVASQPGAPLTFTVSQTTWSVPLEVTTSLRLLSLVTVYGGLGMDWQLGGGSDMTLNMTATLTGKGNLNLGTATINASGHVSPSATRLREIFGVQINAMLVRIFVQMNVTGDTPLLTSVAAGLRLAI